MIARGTRLGPYEIEAPLGAGGMGEVYKGRDTRLDRSVAIKILPSHLAANAAFRQRFEREARSISALNHPHICVLHDVGETRIVPAAGEAPSDAATVAYLVMELCDGPTLAERIARGPLPLEQALRIGAEIADALDRAHRSGITHRDLKPGNIILTKSGAKLLDFGLARSSGAAVAPVDGATELKPITEEGTVIGTFQYMAPEQVEGLEADHRSDIFAFGALLYEMITGKRAFDGKSRASVIAAILERDPQPLLEAAPLTPPLLDRVIRTCLAKDPDERWQSAHDLRKELEWTRDTLSSPGLAPATVVKRVRRERLAWLLAAILPPMTLAAAVLWLRGNDAAPARVVAAVAPLRGTEIIVTGDAAGPPVMSRDGRFVAFVAKNEKGPLLYVQSLQSGDTRAIPGTEKAMFPFWSHDGRSVGFFNAGKLLVSALDGSPPRVIADAPDGRGGAWAPDGSIIYAPYTQSPLMRISAGGGSPVPVTRVEGPYSTHRWPSIHPDGRHLLYVAAIHAAPESPETAIFMCTLDGKESRKLVASPGQGLAWRDWLLYLRAGRVVAQKLEGSELRGEPIPVWEHVLYDAGTWRTSFSVSENGLMTAHQRDSANGDTLLQWLDRTGKRVGELGPAASYRDVSLSPDGTIAALTVGDPGSYIVLHDLKRNARTRFSFAAGAAGDPIWSRDGKQIAFGASESGAFALYVKPTDGSAPERLLLSAPVLLRPSSITPDGRYLLFERGSGAAGDIVRVPLAGGKPEVVVGGAMQQYEARLSPDAKWLAYIAADHGGRNLYITPYPPTGARWQVSNESAYATWWNPKGNEVFYLSAYGIRAVPIETGPTSIRVGTMKPLFAVDVNTNDRGITMTPDGERFLVAPVRQMTSGHATLIANFDLPLRR